MREFLAGIVMAALLLCIAVPSRAAFQGSEVYLPSVGRIAGVGGSQFYSTVWISNLTAFPQAFTFQFLRQNQANPTPPSFGDTLAPGETKLYENVIEGRFGLTNALGAARIVSSGEIFVSERIYNQFPGEGLEKSVGLFFAGVPGSFAIGAGESTTVQGVNQGNTENCRTNFAVIETAGGSGTVRISVVDASGSELGARAYPVLPYEQIQLGVADIVPAISTINARLAASVVAGNCRVILAGVQLANSSQDSSGFEMAFKDSLLGGGSAGVSSLNGLTGDVALSAGANISIAHSGNGLKISATGGGGSSGVSEVNGVTGAVSVAGAGSASVGTSGHTITISTPTALAPAGPAGGALGGTYPNPSIAPLAVGTGQLAPGSVTSDKLGPGSVIAGKIAAGAVSPDSVAFNYAGSNSKGGAATSLSCSACILPSQIHAGLSGQVIASNGLSAFWQTEAVNGHVRVWGGVSLVEDRTSGLAAVDCPGGKRVIGGGVQVSWGGAINPNDYSIERSYAASDTRWIVSVYNDSGTTLQVQAQAICAWAMP